MTCRLVVILLAFVQALVACSSSLADTPPVIAELDTQRNIAQADAARATVQQELDAWTLKQLKTLRSCGHASWQEEAEQEVKAKSTAANALAAQQYLQTVLQWQARLAKLNLPHTDTESECVRLYMPGSARLVAWMSTDVAGVELSKRHLEKLRAEYQFLSDIDLAPLETAIKKAKRQMEVYGRLEKDVDLLHRAEIRLRLAAAECEVAQARKASATVIAERIALAEKSLGEQPTPVEETSPALARLGTRFVDATSDHDLAELVAAMAIDETMAAGQIAWLQLGRDAVLTQMESLQKLTKHPLLDRGECDQAKQQHADLELQIQQAQDALRVQRQMASGYHRSLISLPEIIIEQATSMELGDASVANANIVRHSLELQQLNLRTVAIRTAVEAQHDYLVERMKRVQRIPEQARPPKELEHIRQRVRGIQLHRELVDRELVLLNGERHRFRRQVRSQQARHFQLVQVDDGKFIRREQIELGEALIATVGFVGNAGLFPNKPNTYPYIESATLFDCLSQLRGQSPNPTIGTFGFNDWGYVSPLLQSGAVSTVWNASQPAGGLRLASDWLGSSTDANGIGLRSWFLYDRYRSSYLTDQFCYEPYGWQATHSDYSWASRNLGYVSPRRYRAFHPYDSYPFGLCGQSIFSYRVGFPTRSSFPYRSNYLYRSAFPVGYDVYQRQMLRASGVSRGFGYRSGLSGSCFD